ncbi:MAG: single-stranded-DNA-specific exonuclease RecJ [Patescibacteria group bacterium]|nr:single-stranded-DNA-specific exonuclease RecJ [Patescibacteria group bacterium]
MENNYLWQIAPKIPDDFRNQFPEINPILLQLLWNRGLKTQETIDEFLLPDYSQDLHDPFLFQGMKKAVEKILSLIHQQELITVYGDYDADGICGTTILYLTLKKIGARVDYYIPDREKEGYGLNTTAIRRLAQNGTKLIITVDCGITNEQEVALANHLGLEVIITDHHTPLETLPESLVNLNPKIKDEKYPFKDLSGAGVAFKLVQALLRKSPVFNFQFSNPEAFEKWLLDLVAIGTVADLVELKGENRTLVKYGLMVLNKTSRLGLRALVKEAGLFLGNLGTWHISYQLAPRLNAAGRMDHANTSLRLLLTDDRKEAENLAKKINKINAERQRLVEDIFQKWQSKIGLEPKEKILILFQENWPVGILGLIANKFVDEYLRPILAVSLRQNDIKGVGRSIKEFNLIESLKQLEGFFSHYGGHAGAAGFTFKEKNLSLFAEFCRAIKDIAEDKLKDLDLRHKIFIDTEINFSDINWPLYEEIKKFEPFGQGNPKPIFLARNLIIEDISNVGKNGQHAKIIVGGGKKMIYFDNGHQLNHLKRGDQIDTVFELGENEWDGLKELEFRILDLKKSETL